MKSERTDSKQNQLLITRPQKSLSTVGFVGMADCVVLGL